MKVFKYLTVLTSSLLLTVSCNDLDLGPEDYYGSQNFWKTEAQAKGYMLGLHRELRSNYVNYWLLGEARGGTQITTSTSLANSVSYSAIKSQNLTSANTGIANWVGFYGNILRINWAIKQIENANYLKDTDKQQMLAQSYGLRAWYYFWLYRTYGGVPMNKETKVLDKTPENGIDLYTPRSTPKEILDLIKEDIAKSESYFGNSTALIKSQWTIYTTKMLKAEVYLWSAKVTTGNQTPAGTDLATAESALNFVKNSGRFSLLPSFSNVFAHNNKENAEIIFSMPFLENEATNHFSQFMYNPNDFNSKFKADGTPIPTNDPLNIASGAGVFRNEYIFPLFEQFDATDSRKTATFYDFYGTATGGGRGIVLTKYMGFINTSGKRIWSSDIPVYRYSDVLLMLAEVENKKGGDPAQYINQVRKRAYGTAYNATAHGYTNGSFAENELAILKERDKEFVAENKRWFDIIRLQDASGKPLVFSTEANYDSSTAPILNPSTEAHKVLWPINKGVTDTDPEVEQTPGY